MYGFHGRLLHIDLSTGQSSWVDLEESRLRAFLGGIGLGTSLLYEYAPPGVDPFSAANPLIFTSAPLVGTGLTTTAKYAVVTKSPLTGFIADSLSSSHFALELKRLGVDALIITGRAAAMAYIFIRNDKVEIRAPNICAARVPARLKPRSAPNSRIADGARCRHRQSRRKSWYASPRSATKGAMPAAAASARSWDRRISRPSRCAAIIPPRWPIRRASTGSPTRCASAA